MTSLPSQLVEPVGQVLLQGPRSLILQQSESTEKWLQRKASLVRNNMGTGLFESYVIYGSPSYNLLASTNEEIVRQCKWNKSDDRLRSRNGGLDHLDCEVQHFQLVPTDHRTIWKAIKSLATEWFRICEMEIDGAETVQHARQQETRITEIRPAGARVSIDCLYLKVGDVSCDMSRISVEEETEFSRSWDACVNAIRGGLRTESVNAYFERYDIPSLGEYVDVEVGKLSTIHLYL